MLQKDISLFTVPGKVGSISWSPDGKFLAVSYDADRKIALYDPANGHQIWVVDKRNGVAFPQRSLSFLDDGSVLFTSSAVSLSNDNSEKTISIISSADGKIQRTLSYKNPPQGQNLARAVSVSRTKQKIYVIPGAFNEVISYDLNSWKCEAVYELKEPNIIGGYHLVSDENRQLMAITEGAYVKIFDLKNMKLANEFHPFQVTINAVAINHKTGDLILGGTGAFWQILNRQTNQLENFEDDPNKLVQAWSLETGKKTHVYEGPGNTTLGVTVSPNGDMLAAIKSGTVSDNTAYVLLWNANSGKLISVRELSGVSSGDISFSPDRAHLAFAVDDIVHVVGLRSAELGSE